MQLPSAKTPVSKCEELSLFTCTMLSKFPQNPTLAALVGTLEGAGAGLAAAQATYAAGVRSLVSVRVDVRYADHIADAGVRAAQRAAETADGKKGGKISSLVFAGGVTPIVRPVGATQVKAMRDLEGRIDAAASVWPEAQAEKSKIVQLRTNYEGALEARRAGLQKVSDLRAARNAAKEDFLDVYATVANRVRSEFTRDRAMQDLFFDRVSVEADGEVVEEEAEAPEGAGVAPSPA